MANKVEFSRRGKDDPYWKECKDIVDKRDKKRCRFLACISAKEYYMMKGEGQSQIDHAHIFSASSEPSLIYEPKNVVCLTRFIHRRMDDFKNPLTGKPVELNEHYYWWYRIFTARIFDFDVNINYEKLLKQEICENGRSNR